MASIPPEFYILIPVLTNHSIHLSESRPQNFASASSYLNMTRLPARLSHEIQKDFIMKAFVRKGIKQKTLGLLFIEMMKEK